MAVALRHERGNIYSVSITGRLLRSDLDAVQRAVTAEIDRGGTVRLLFELKRFEGWEPGANWDLDFYIRRGDRIERIAIVADERWRSETLMFAAADLRKGDVEFFPTSAASEARAWLSA